MPILALAPPERLDEVERNLETLRAGGQIDPYQTERMRKDGTRWPALLSISPLLNRRGEIVGASAIAHDISAEKKSEEALRQREKLATAGRLAASIAHEINNPLEAVVNLLYLARADSSHANEHLAMAEQEVGRVARLAQQTLGFVRDSNAPGSLDPAAIMDEVLQLYSHKLLARRIRVERRYRDGGTIHANSGQLRQLFSNLIVNATDAMPKEGCLRVRVAPSHDWGDGREGIRITVADNGSGIPSENLPRVFEPFYTTKRETGTGLGLWISGGIVREHGGTINIRSRVEGRGKGTVFSIFFPHQYEAIRVA